jgi:hypothetical protein
MRRLTEESSCVTTVECGAVSRQRLGKHIPTAIGTQATIKVLLETMSSTRSVENDYKEDNWSKNSSVGMELLFREDSRTEAVEQPLLEAV